MMKLSTLFVAVLLATVVAAANDKDNASTNNGNNSTNNGNDSANNGGTKGKSKCGRPGACNSAYQKCVKNTDTCAQTLTSCTDSQDVCDLAYEDCVSTMRPKCEREKDKCLLCETSTPEDDACADACYETRDDCVSQAENDCDDKKNSVACSNKAKQDHTCKSGFNKCVRNCKLKKFDPPETGAYKVQEGECPCNVMHDVCITRAEGKAKLDCPFEEPTAEEMANCTDTAMAELDCDDTFAVCTCIDTQ